MFVIEIPNPTDTLGALILTALLKIMVTGLDPVFAPTTEVEDFQLMAKYLSEFKQVVHTKLITHNQTTKTSRPLLPTHYALLNLTPFTPSEVLRTYGTLRVPLRSPGLRFKSDPFGLRF